MFYQFPLLTIQIINVIQVKIVSRSHQEEIGLALLYKPALTLSTLTLPTLLRCTALQQTEKQYAKPFCPIPNGPQERLCIDDVWSSFFIILFNLVAAGRPPKFALVALQLPGRRDLYCCTACRQLDIVYCRVQCRSASPIGPLTNIQDSTAPCIHSVASRLEHFAFWLCSWQ